MATSYEKQQFLHKTTGLGHFFLYPEKVPLTFSVLSSQNNFSAVSLGVKNKTPFRVDFGMLMIYLGY